MLCIDVSFDFFGRNMLDVGLAGIQLFNFGLIEVESGDALANVGKPECERKSNVPAADNSDLDTLIRKKLRFTVHPYSPCACFRISDSKNSLNRNSNDSRGRMDDKGAQPKAFRSTL